MNTINTIISSAKYYLYNILSFKRKALGLPWQSSGKESVLPLQRAQVWSLVGEHAMWCGQKQRGGLGGGLGGAPVIPRSPVLGAGRMLERLVRG